VLALEAAGDGPLPLEVLLAVMRYFYGRKQYARAAAIAAQAAPYVHPRLSSITHKGDKEEPLRLVEEIVLIDADTDPPAPAAPPAPGASA